MGVTVIPAISYTIDGVHLNAGYAVWDAALWQGAASICDSEIK